MIKEDYQKAVDGIDLEYPLFTKTKAGAQRKQPIIRLKWRNSQSHFEYIPRYSEVLRVLALLRQLKEEPKTAIKEIEDYNEFKRRVKECLEI